jgi:hypothetical protein
MKIERAPCLVALTGTALLWSAACVDPYQTDRVSAVERCGSYVFTLRSDKPLRELDVVELSDMGRIVDVLWRITADQSSPQPPSVCYGVVPRGFRQLIPRSGSPERLGPRRYRVRTRSYAIDEDASHFYRLGPAGEAQWRLDAGRNVPFGEAAYGFRIDEAGRVVTPRSGR